MFVRTVKQNMTNETIFIFLRDFAYVARDRVSRKHMCHVFRCDTPARTIANTLRDICKKIMIERSLQQNMNKPLDTSEYSAVMLM